MKRTWLVAEGIHEGHLQLFMTVEDEMFQHWFKVSYQVIGFDHRPRLHEYHYALNLEFREIDPNGNLSMLDAPQIAVIRFVESHPGIEFDPLWDRIAI